MFWRIDMHEQITPLLLTFDELPNLPRALAKLAWAKRIVVVDSGSGDGTREFLATQPNVEVYQRKFDNHAAQWNYGLSATAIDTAWVLCLDADYVLSDALVGELASLEPSLLTTGYFANFVYMLDGVPLRGSLYPPGVVLFRHGKALYRQTGHTQRLTLEGTPGQLAAPIFHDDRKPLTRWRASQRKYAALEAAWLKARPWGSLRLTDRIRRVVVIAPWLVPMYTLLARGVILDGKAGWRYAMQRGYAETLIARALLGFN